MEILVLLSSGLFMGWSLGANDAANVFGTAVGTRMVKFRTASLICSLFIVLGAVVSGSGAVRTLGQLGAVNALPGAFTVALAAGLATLWMTRLGLPVSTSQAVVGAIIGWNVYSSSVTDRGALTRIVTTWVACPILAGVLAVLLYLLLRAVIRKAKPHLLQMDSFTRYGLMIVGAMGSYSLGANNIANVVGVFLPENPFPDVSVLGVEVAGAQLLFGLGALAIGLGVVTYSQKVMGTVGGGIVKLSPLAALVVVLAQAVTLFLFASERLEHVLASAGLPTFPLVPVSSSQAVIGAIIGLGLLKGGRGLRYRLLGGISLGWLATPIVAGAAAYILLFFVDNVFDRRVYQTCVYRIDESVIAEMDRRHQGHPRLREFLDRQEANPIVLRQQLQQATGWRSGQLDQIMTLAKVQALWVSPAVINEGLDRSWLTVGQIAALHALADRRFERPWEFQQALASSSPEWRLKPDAKINRAYNRDLQAKRAYVERLFQRAALQ